MLGRAREVLLAGTVGTTLLIKGRKIRLREAYGDDMESFKAALAKVSQEAKRLRDAAKLDGTTGRKAFRKKKATKDA